LNSTILIGWDPAFAFADWLGSKTWCGHVVQLATLCFTTVSLACNEGQTAAAAKIAASGLATIENRKYTKHNLLNRGFVKKKKEKKEKAAD